MKSYKIAVLKGDGIGPEIVDEAVKVLNAIGKKNNIAFEYDEKTMGGAAIDLHGTPLPDETLEACKKADSVLLGAVGGPKWDTVKGDKRPETGLLKIRKELGLYANLRPAKVFPALATASPLKAESVKDGLDIMVVRELTGGIYFGKRGREEIDGEMTAFDTERYAVSEIRRIAITAFNIAMTRGKRVMSVDKANVLESSRLWRETVIDVHKAYPEVELSHMYVDNAAMQLVRNPAQFDVLLTNNIFGDILSDEASMISGSIGLLASASLADGTFGLYEPIHGSAPDIAGTGRANPIATILSVAMMLQYSFGEKKAARQIEVAVEEALNTARTPDIFEAGFRRVTTSEMGDLVASLI